MSRPGLLILLGVLVFLLPFSGLPMSWRAFLLPVCGIAIAVIGVSLRTPRALPPLESAKSAEPAHSHQAIG